MTIGLQLPLELVQWHDNMKFLSPSAGCRSSVRGGSLTTLGGRYRKSAQRLRG